LVTALRGWIPPDRSFVYGYVVYALTARSRSLASLVAAQTFAGILTSMLTAGILVRFFRVSFFVAAAASIVLSLAAQQLMYERFVLTESFSTMVFAGFLFLALEYLRSRKRWLLAALQITGVLLIAFRVTFVPMIAATAVAAPFIAYAGDWKKFRR